MGRAIGIAFLLVVFSVGFVLLRLGTRRSTSAPAPPRRQQMFVTRDDGSVYAVSLQLTQFEQRLMEEEERSRKLQEQLEALRKERDAMGKSMEQLQEELRRLRRQVTQPAPRPAPSEPPAEPEEGVAPDSGASATPTPPPGG